MTAAAGRRPAALRLTVDGGNTRVKLVLWGRGSEPLGSWRRSWDELADPGALAGVLDELPGTPGRAALSSVASEARTRTLAAGLAARVGELVLAPACGLVNATLDPPGVGLDRLYAARGALALAGRDALVVDAGTALTVDAVLARGGGTFLGGAIAPGPALLARALAGESGGPARLPGVTPRPAARALGRDTREAIESGVGVGFRGAASALVEGVAREAGLEGAPVVLTGGAAGFLEGAFRGRAVLVCEELVHRGLVLALDGLPDGETERGPAAGGVLR